MRHNTSWPSDESEKIASEIEFKAVTSVIIAKGVETFKAVEAALAPGPVPLVEWMATALSALGVQRVLARIVSVIRIIQRSI